jgi:hypothetical protein
MAEAPVSYGKIKIGSKSVNDAILNLGALYQANKNYGNKEVILKALANNDVATLRDISKYFYRTSGIYERTCNYFATMYRYDWYIVPEVYDDGEKIKEKMVMDF